MSPASCGASSNGWTPINDGTRHWACQSRWSASSSRTNRPVGLPRSPFGHSSRFPLLLIFVTLLGYFLPSSLQGDVLGSVTSFLPLLSTNSIGQLDIPATDADYRAYDAYAKERTYHHDEGVHTEFPRHDPDDG